MKDIDDIIRQAGAAFVIELHKQGIIVRNFNIARQVPSSLNDNQDKKEICVTFKYFERNIDEYSAKNKRRRTKNSLM